MFNFFNVFIQIFNIYAVFKNPNVCNILQKKYFLSGMLKVEFMVYLQIHTKITWNLWFTYKSTLRFLVFVRN